MDQQKIRVLIVDDSSFMRNILSRMIERDPRFEIVGKAHNGQQGIEMAAQLSPDVITMDIEMPEMNGLQALQYIMSSNPIPVVMVSSLTEAGTEATLRALELGAVDFIPKALNDSENAIFRSAENIHQRLIAAAGAQVKKTQNSRTSTAVPASPNQATAAAAPKPQASAQEPVKQAPPAQTGARPQVARFDKAQILLIGSSTGGPRALQEVLGGLPANLRVPVVVVQHMPANFTGPMASRLNDLAPLTVKEAASGMLLEKGCVYVCPGGMQTRLEKVESGIAFRVMPDEGESLFRPSVEVMGAAVRDIYGNKVLAVMLTGMGHDGSKVYKQLSELGAYIVAQDQATSVVYGMPKAVVDSGAANETVPLDQVAAVVTKLLQ